jgi:transcription elongation factor GreA
VGSPEADPSRDLISNESPVGRALLGRRKGEVVDVEAPGGKLKYTVLQIKV